MEAVIQLETEQNAPAERDLEEFGPKMQALNERQRKFVLAYFEHPNYSATALAKEAGYSEGPKGSTQLRVVGHRMMHHTGIIDAINEEAHKRMLASGYIGVAGVVKIALNEQHRDHLKACLALMDRTGHHATSEHKVTVDDRRPQTRRELLDAVRTVAEELGLDKATIGKMVGETIDAEFVEVEPLQLESVDALIAREMENL